jgi:membrane-associated phospholipid phosphatase
VKTALIWVAAIGGVALLIFGNRRLRICVLFTALAVGTNDGLICNPLKHAVARARPFVMLPEARVFGTVGKDYVPPEYDSMGVNMNAGKGSHNSMPSAHAANCFAAAMALFLFYRRSAWFMVPFASAVAFSRLYNGVHYPSDVLAGALIGAGWVVAVAVLLQMLWSSLGKKYFPAAHAKMPTLVPNLNLGKSPAR